MAYRRRHGLTKASTFKEEIRHPSEESSSSSLAAQAIRASSAHRDSSFSSAYGESALASAYKEPNHQRSFGSRQDPTSYKYTSFENLNESKHGFWGILARKAKAILDDDNAAQQFETSNKTTPQVLETSTGGRFQQPYLSSESGRKSENPKIQKGLDAITSSLNYLGGTIGKSLEEGLTIVENRTADIIQETRRLQIRKKGSGSDSQNQANDVCAPQQQAQMQMDHETQLKASRDVAMATAAKAKLLLRELKTVKADLAFAKERCAQLEEENRILRESHEKGDSPEDDDLIRLQLETLLAEKARLAHENSIYARENRFLREIVEYHQLTMQDVVYLDEGIEEVTEVRPISVSRTTSASFTSIPTSAAPTPPSTPPLSSSPSAPSPHVFTATVSPVVDKDVLPVPTSPVREISCSVPPGSSVHVPAVEDPKHPSSKSSV
ncbi:uncharacterized protein LOC122648819 isoform X2 [Telopea speciosissima]|uniref:uncharacterized protein LOC122648819 isoform X2 n=1 Tax=Telopea speciosissima TaxID=54955 RepID=UPI001CC8249B|nr:uncharacterized protein LOC122648819 isoform X2 [Telopea speciosissima]